MGDIWTVIDAFLRMCAIGAGAHFAWNALKHPARAIEGVSSDSRRPRIENIKRNLYAGLSFLGICMFVGYGVHGALDWMPESWGNVQDDTWWSTRKLLAWAAAVPGGALFWNALKDRAEREVARR